RRREAEGSKTPTAPLLQAEQRAAHGVLFLEAREGFPRRTGRLLLRAREAAFPARARDGALAHAPGDPARRGGDPRDEPVRLAQAGQPPPPGGRPPPEPVPPRPAVVPP